MKAARAIFALAAFYGLLVLVPGVFIEWFGNGSVRLAQPEFYFGFYGSALVWQGAFLVIASDPARFRPLMLVAVAEKGAFLGSCLWLWATGRIDAGGPLAGALIDGVWMIAFLIAYWRSAPPRL